MSQRGAIPKQLAARKEEDDELASLLKAKLEIEDRLERLNQRAKERSPDLLNQDEEELNATQWWGIGSLEELNSQYLRDLDELNPSESSSVPPQSSTPSVKESVKDGVENPRQNITPPRRLDPDVKRLLEEIHHLPPPQLKLTLPTKTSAAELHKENVKRNRIIVDNHPRQKTSMGRELRSNCDNPKAEVALSVMVKPQPLEKAPTFTEILEELGVPELANPQSKQQPLYMVDCRIVSQKLLKDINQKQAEALVRQQESTKVDRGTQTFVSIVGKRHVVVCVNCRSREHHFRSCQLPYRPGFCQVCGADGFDTENCIYPHGIEHEQALGRCPGCSRDLSLYCPECPDCNIRHGDLVDWLRLNYATMPTWAIPSDHRYLVNEGEQVLKRKVKAKFDDQPDYANRLRTFLIRENALIAKIKLVHLKSKLLC